MTDNLKTCSVAGCGAKHAAKGYCRKHYMRIWNNGTLALQSAEPFERKYQIDPVTGCWIWQRAVNKDGYGKSTRNGRTIGAHRHSWELANGPIPSGMLLCHRCDNPPCVNPLHLFLGDHAANHADRGAKGRTASGERAGQAKLTAEQVVEIRRTRPGEREAKARFGISRTHYFRLIRGESWGNINV